MGAGASTEITEKVAPASAEDLSTFVASLPDEQAAKIRKALEDLKTPRAPDAAANSSSGYMAEASAEASAEGAPVTGATVEEPVQSSQAAEPTESAAAEATAESAKPAAEAAAEGSPAAEEAADKSKEVEKTEEAPPAAQPAAEAEASAPAEKAAEASTPAAPAAEPAANVPAAEAPVAFELTAEQLENVKKTFEAIDADKSGSIDPKELTAALKALGQDVSEEEMKATFSNLDINADGKVTVDEYIKMVQDALRPK